jgi:hypothetical protein
MKFFLATSDDMQKLRDKVNDFLGEHPSIVIHSHQFATCGTQSKNKYVSIFYDAAPEYLTIKNKKDDTGEERSL